MNGFLKTAVLTVAVGATTLATLPAANADDWRFRRHHGNGDAIAAGVLGLAAGAIIAGALTSQPPPPGPIYYDDGYYPEPRRAPRPRPAPVRNYYEPQVVYNSYALEPWTPEWYSYCSDRYRTFNARTGTFTGYDGAQHFCVAN